MAPSLSRLAAFAALASAANAAHWAVIMAGSTGFWNYRHQADACHAYHVLKDHGFPESNIILLAYDDIATNLENPFAGKIFNSPAGHDVYAGCRISYRRAKVTASNFLKVLQGDTSAGGPVLNSTAEDNVFIYYADHGAPGILEAPVGNPLHASDINRALVNMHKKGMYKKLLFYVEACESGSIFAGLLTAPNVKAVTAAGPDEPSYGYYCPPLDVIGDRAIGSCLGDQFSINWLEDADAAFFANETVGQQIAKVVNKTTKSHVSQYGNASLDSETVGSFLGNVSQRAALRTPRQVDESPVKARDIELDLAHWAVRRATTQSEKCRAEANLRALVAQRAADDAKYKEVALLAAKGNASFAAQLLNGNVYQITKAACHKRAVSEAVEYCGAFTDYSMKHSRLLANLCESDLGQEDNAVLSVIRRGCELAREKELATAASCAGSADPPATGCYKGTGGALGITETVSVDVTSYSAGSGTARFSATGFKPFNCESRSFQKEGQEVTVDLSDCLPDGIVVNDVKYCSDSDKVQVTVADKAVPLPITVQLSRSTCAAQDHVVV